MSNRQEALGRVPVCNKAGKLGKGRSDWRNLEIRGETRKGRCRFGDSRKECGYSKKKNPRISGWSTEQGHRLKVTGGPWWASNRETNKQRKTEAVKINFSGERRRRSRHTRPPRSGGTNPAWGGEGSENEKDLCSGPEKREQKTYTLSYV